MSRRAWQTVLALTALAAAPAFLCAQAQDVPAPAPAGSTAAVEPEVPAEPSAATKTARQAGEADSQPGLQDETPARESGHNAPPAARPPLGKDDGDPNGLGINDFDALGQLWKVLGWLVVLAVVAGAAVLVSKRLLPRLVGSPAGRNLSVKETAYLGPKKTIHIVQVGRRKLLLGSSAEGVRMLADVTDALDFDAELAAASHRGEDQSGGSSA